MKKINLRISELRHKKKITQQELADVVGVSFQTISKWENGSVMPDITYLPMLAEYFEVSVDQLIGIVPLSEETYSASKTGSKEFWEQKLEYLLRTRNNMWNSDYMEFLITKVWKIDKPVKVLDCGCGCGFLGLLMMPFLPSGSTYTGIDIAASWRRKNFGTKTPAECTPIILFRGIRMRKSHRRKHMSLVRNL